MSLVEEIIINKKTKISRNPNAAHIKIQMNMALAELPEIIDFDL